MSGHWNRSQTLTWSWDRPVAWTPGRHSSSAHSLHPKCVTSISLPPVERSVVLVTETLEFYAMIGSKLNDDSAHLRKERPCLLVKTCDNFINNRMSEKHNWSNNRHSLVLCLYNYYSSNNKVKKFQFESSNIRSIILKAYIFLSNSLESSFFTVDSLSGSYTKTSY